MQPLMYQFTNVTCWYASMINGIMLLRHRCTGDPWKSLLSPMEDRLLRSLTAQYTEFSTDAFKREDQYEYYVSVMECLGKIAHFNIYTYRRGEVENEVRGLNFDHEVAVCNTSNGKHAILLHGRIQGRIKCFDPCWADVSQREENENYSVKPRDPQTNLRVTEEHLLSAGTDPFKMGNDHRFLTILRRDSRDHADDHG